MMSATNTSLPPRRNSFKLGWKLRHLVVILLAVAGTYAFTVSRSEWVEMHRWNRAVGDMSVVLIALSMAIGPLVRLRPFLGRMNPWRRELGIHGVLLAVIHTIIILAGWVEWELMRILGYQLHPQTGLYVMLQHGFALGNVVGIVALVYGGVLAFTSNNWSQKKFGGSAWKFVQQGAYVLWMLIILHTAYFLYLHFQDFHRPVPGTNWAQFPFMFLVAAISSLQLAAFYKTWRSRTLSSRAVSHKKLGDTREFA